jgi:hypothetical protein
MWYDLYELYDKKGAENVTKLLRLNWIRVSHAKSIACELISPNG